MGDEEKLIATNRQASRRYELRDTYEAGLVLVGSEVKSLREAKGVQLTESYADVSQSGEMWLRSLHIAAYTHAQDHSGHEPTRPRKMLLHRLELDRIAAKVAQERLSIVPLRLYFKGSRVKVEFALGKPKKTVDRRRDIAERDVKRETERELARSAKQR
ncbi:MAG: SsrA-binding protein SmpB [Candidatus Microthrix sp.]|jgi:SsrA-binding protein|uniref:SsrA-binding protein n=1 Tax=Candidatus Neomicrothrix subdominans TaxID=2954438 RepID=A0A936N9R3_9ACTN|nr:SsrA-binding protein SmpB [Candidatus Microthrix sp.]MBK9296252.1 SsrA-binding protein SmpB [Candidatus Microthrix subdominans]MBK6310151.1 SsrA-binding protein SmpB [Candidatus Microthrix sp.]MBK6439361.1 SsrA-binding protein SmpB [Candidatus Microthrix sp.]MBK6967670.1 SsrA-binding protein SmpB [Candidatus Microthrix sp.]MBK7164715.1 SsrA-binding protein SmpB [Candidatus Microthrix sp.]